jgi:hypothetical protein
MPQACARAEGVGGEEGIKPTLGSGEVNVILKFVITIVNLMTLWLVYSDGISVPNNSKGGEGNSGRSEKPVNITLLLHVRVTKIS